MKCTLSNYNHPPSILNCFYLSCEGVTSVVLSATWSKGNSEAGQLLAKGWFVLCVEAMVIDQGNELSPPSSS